MKSVPMSVGFELYLAKRRRERLKKEKRLVKKSGSKKEKRNDN